MREVVTLCVLPKIFNMFVIEVDLTETEVIIEKNWLQKLSEEMISEIGFEKTSELIVGDFDDGDFNENVLQAVQLFSGGSVNFIYRPEEKLLYLCFLFSLLPRESKANTVLQEIIKKCTQSNKLQLRISSLRF